MGLKEDIEKVKEKSKQWAELIENVPEKDKEVAKEITKKAKLFLQKELTDSYSVWSNRNIHDRPIVHAKIIHSTDKLPFLHDKIYSGTKAACENYCKEKKIEITD